MIRNRKKWIAALLLTLGPGGIGLGGETRTKDTGTGQGHPPETAKGSAIANEFADRFLAPAPGFVDLKEYRAMLTAQDVARAAVPFPETRTIDRPPGGKWEAILRERRIKRLGKPRT